MALFANRLKSNRALRLLIAGLSVVGFALAAIYLRENFHVVVPGKVYRSAQPTAAMLREYAKDPGIRSVVNLRGAWPEKDWHAEEVKAVKELGLSYYEVPLNTHQLTAMYNVRQLIEIFDHCPKPVLLHCRQGSDRTSLASALYLLLHEGKSPAQARQAYRLVYGHTGWSHGYHLPHLFDLYEDWLTEKQLDHSPECFREWVNTNTILGPFGAKIECENESALTDKEALGELEFRVTNTSQQTWTMSSWPESGMHLVLKAYDSKGQKLWEKTASAGDRAISPKEAVTIRFEVPAGVLAGLGSLKAEMADRYGIHFGTMGVAPWTRVLTNGELVSAR